MGWTNSHLHQFVKDRKFYSPPEEEDFMDRSSNTYDYPEIKVSDLLEAEKDRIIYEYDFGDSWIHDIILEKVLPLDKEKYYPVCIEGKKNTPPEDIGGIPGYYQFLEARKDPNHELRDFFDPFLMKEFDPDDFDKEDINEALKMKDYGCINFDDEHLI